MNCTFPKRLKTNKFQGAYSETFGAQRRIRSASIKTVAVIISIYLPGFMTSGLRESFGRWTLGIIGYPLHIAAVIEIPLLLLFIGYALKISLRGGTNKPDQIRIAVVGFLALISLIIGIISNENAQNFYIGAMTIFPFCLTLLIIFSLSYEERCNIFYYSVFLFFPYLLISLAYWIYVLQPLNNPSFGLPYLRMGNALASTVYLGFIIVAFISFFLFIENSRTKPRPTFIILGLVTGFLSILATGSRSGILLFMGLGLFAVVFRTKRLIRRVLTGIVLVILVVLLLRFGDVKDYRFFSLDISDRYSSWVSSADQLLRSEPSSILLGFGWGRVYPYWQWVEEGSRVWDDQNIFYLNQRISLVSPHNSFLWIAIEGGIILFAVLFFLIARGLIAISRKIRKVKGSWFLLYGEITLILMISLSDCLVTDLPTAYICWIMLFLGPTLVKIQRNDSIRTNKEY